MTRRMDDVVTLIKTKIINHKDKILVNLKLWEIKNHMHTKKVKKK